MEAIIILAGGSGTRLWPASTKKMPKQFLSLGRERSFLQESVERGLAASPGAEIVVVTHRDYVEATADQLAEYAAAGAVVTILPEPAGRNTAPAIAFAVAYLGGRLDGTARVLVLSADHLIRPVDKFAATAGKAAELAAGGFIAVFGIPPSEPNTGYGYIETGEPEGPGFRVKAFREKPDAETAVRYAASGRHYWNSGMFLFSLGTIRDELAVHAPEVAEPFRRLAEAGSVGTGRTVQGVRIWGEGEAVRSLYEKLPSISIDYAVMEKSRAAAMVPADFEWTDVGSWDEAARIFPGRAPRILEIESGDCAVYSDIPVALCGVRDIVVVIRNGHALVMKKGSSQLVRDAAREMDP